MLKSPFKTNQNNPQIKSYREALRKGRNSQHVLPRDGVWIVKKTGSSKPSGIFSTQQEAKKSAENIAKNQSSSIFIHGKDGRIKSRKYF